MPEINQLDKELAVLKKQMEERSVVEEGLSKSEIDKIKAETPPEYIRKELNATRVS